MEILEFIKPELLVLIPVLYILGAIIKRTDKIKDNFIPLTVGVAGIVLSVLYVMATVPVLTMQDGFMSVFTAITQGVLVAGASVYTNQLIKQTGGNDNE